MEQIKIDKLGKALATELSDGVHTWRYVGPKLDRPGSKLRRADGLELTLGFNRQSKTPQFHIAQSYHCAAWVDSDGQRLDPREYVPGSGQRALPSINVAQTKSAAVIAKDVMRRVLPDADANHARGLAMVVDYNSSHAKREEYGDAMGCDARTDDRANRRMRHIYQSNTPDGVGTVEIEAASYGIEIKVDHLDAKTAKRVLRALGIKAG